MNVVGGGFDGIALKDTLRLSFGKIHQLRSQPLYNLLCLPPLSLSLQVLLSTIELQALYLLQIRSHFICSFLSTIKAVAFYFPPLKSCKLFRLRSRVISNP